MNVKPVILVTRKMPDAVEARLKRDYSPILNPDDKLYSEEEIIKLAAKADAILPCHTERMTADLIRRLPHNVKAIANFSVGVDHCDLEAARNKGIIVTNTPDVLSDATAEIAILLMHERMNKPLDSNHFLSLLSKTILAAPLLLLILVK